MKDELVISIDAMGGDNAPRIVIEGIDFFLKNIDHGQNISFLLHGDEGLISEFLQKTSHAKSQTQIQHTSKAIDMDEKPSAALRRGKGSSLWNTIESVKSGDAKIAVSAGNTGGLMAISKVRLRMMPGVQRPALAAQWPNPNGASVVLDVGANVDCDAAQLTEFAVMGEAFYRAVFNKQRPSVGLLNVGVEEGKGNAVVNAAHDRLNESKLGLNYIGYVEGNDISMGGADVIVTDGFSGNIALKASEGTAKLVQSYLRMALKTGLWSKFTTALNSISFARLKKKIDPRNVNGAVLLGLNGLVIKSHGGTDAIGYANALKVAVSLAQGDFLSEIDRTLTALHDEDADIGFVS